MTSKLFNQKQLDNLANKKDNDTASSLMQYFKQVKCLGD